MVLTRGIKSGLKWYLGSSIGMALLPESQVGTNTSEVMPPSNDDAMVCEPSIPLLTLNGIITKTQGNGEDNLTASPGNKEDILDPGASSVSEFFAKYGLLRTNFTSYASFLLKSSAGGGSENNVLDNVKIFSLSTVVQFLEQQLVKVAEATSLEFAKSKEAYKEKMLQHLNEYEKKLNDVNITSEAKTRELNCQLQEVSKEHSATQYQLRCAENTLSTSQLELQDCKLKAHNTKVDLESKLRHSQESTKATDREVRRLESSILEKDKALEKLKVETSYLISKCQKMESQLAQIEQKAAQESLTSGSYADDHANPSMLEEACKRVDKATDDMVRVLHGRSITSNSSAESQYHLERVLDQISPAKLTNFSRPVQVKYAWGHWICGRMFHGFEHVFFDVDWGSTTSPLDPKTHALECFHSYQQKKQLPSSKLYEGFDLFRAFCIKKYLRVFPLAIVKQALYPQLTNMIICDSYGRFNDDNEIYQQFLDVAKEIWLLHQLSFSFDPPAGILRMAPGLSFDKQYHEPVIHDADNNEMHQAVLLMIRPAFRLRNTIIRSRVFLSTPGLVDCSKRPEEQQVEQRDSSLVTAPLVSSM